ncbi:HigA family addiction module antitoxin [Acetobacterium sp.]|uniref:HigA family addiction module antitoxin n=1 Tax=Acetobacterium sp. TaxID=1872094 RepID=UPI002F40F510
MIKNEYKSSILIHPGVHIRNIIEDMEINQEELAKRLGVTPKTVSEIVNGKANISNEMTQKLATMLGTSVGVWINLQKAYDEKIIEQKIQDELENDKEVLALLDMNFFIKSLKIIEKGLHKHKKIEFLRTYFGISSLQQLKSKDLLVNCRKSDCTPNEVKNIVPINAWVQTAINFGKDIQTHSYNSALLKSYLPEIRSMTKQEPTIFLPRLTDILKECGIAFVVLPHLKNSKINGAVRWVCPEKAILAINARGAYADLFWFTLFHELKHVFQHKTKDTFLNYFSDGILDAVNQALEKEADEFSQQTLIPPSKYLDFILVNNFSRNAIVSFSSSINIHPGIVVGRLQHDSHLRFNQYLSLKERYAIVA